MKTGIELIQEERNRQITSENYTSEHDDKYSGSHLSFAATSYCYYANNQPFDNKEDQQDINDECLIMWPWDNKYWKPSEDKVRNLVKAGALIAAEIDRLQRLNNTDDFKSAGEFMTKEEVRKLQNFEYSLGEDGMTTGTEYDE